MVLLPGITSQLEHLIQVFVQLLMPMTLIQSANACESAHIESPITYL